MSFRQSINASDQWQTFCHKHAEYTNKLPRLSPLFATADRFDQFLQTGVLDYGDNTLTIMSLSDEEWVPFALFVDHYSNDWQTCFVRTLYGGFYREDDKRHWHPSTNEFVMPDLSHPYLVIHFWAKWDAHDRTMDKNLSRIIPHYEERVVFRSLDVDRPEFRDVCTDADALSIPALAFYNSGVRSQKLIGVRPPDALANTIQEWLDSS